MQSRQNSLQVYEIVIERVSENGYAVPHFTLTIMPNDGGIDVKALATDRDREDRGEQSSEALLQFRGLSLVLHTERQGKPHAE